MQDQTRMAPFDVGKFTFPFKSILSDNFFQIIISYTI